MMLPLIIFADYLRHIAMIITLFSPCHFSLLFDVYALFLFMPARVMPRFDTPPPELPSITCLMMRYADVFLRC